MLSTSENVCALDLLPREVLENVSGWLEDLEDLERMAESSECAAEALRVAPLRLTLRSKHGEQSESWETDVHERISKRFEKAKEIRIVGLKVTDVQVIRVLEAYRESLELISLEECQKITPDLLDHFAEDVSGRRWVEQDRLSGKGNDSGRFGCIRILSLQRCYRMSSLQCAKLIGRMTTCPSPLSTIILTHLDMAGAVDELNSSGCTIPSSSPKHHTEGNLRHLALLQCTNFSLHVLASISHRCIHLRTLSIGGCGFIVLEGDLSGESRAANAEEVAVACSRMPMLQILDMSCCSAPDADEVAKCIARSCPPERCPRVWDLTRPAHVEDALHVVNVGWRELGLERESMRTMASAMACCSNSSRRAPLHVAVELNDARMVKSLLQLGANVNARDRSGATPTFLAAENGKIEALDALMSSENVDARIANSAGETPLYISALRGHLSVVSILLEHFRAQNISWYDPHMYTDGWTPLMAAAVADHDKVANLLLQAAIMSGGLQAFLNAANRYGQTALHIAARRGFKNFIALLISKGADPQVRDCYGLTAFEVAKGNRQENVVVALC